jgi:hypothetical protein
MADTLAALGLRVSAATAAAAAAAAALTLTLFVGSLLQSALDGTLRWPGAGLSALQTIRVLLVAPLAEEWCFRACEDGLPPTTASFSHTHLFSSLSQHGGLSIGFSAQPLTGLSVKAWGGSAARGVVTLCVLVGT